MLRCIEREGDVASSPIRLMCLAYLFAPTARSINTGARNEVLGNSVSQIQGRISSRDAANEAVGDVVCGAYRLLVDRTKVRDGSIQKIGVIFASRRCLLLRLADAIGVWRDACTGEFSISRWLRGISRAGCVLRWRATVRRNDGSFVFDKVVLLLLQGTIINVTSSNREHRGAEYALAHAIEVNLPG